MDDDAWSQAGRDFFVTAPLPSPAPAGVVPPAAAPPPAVPAPAVTAPATVPVGRRLGFGEALEVGLNLARSSWTLVTRAPVLLGVTAVSLAVGLVLVAVYAAALGGPAALATGGRGAAAVKMFPLLVLLAVTGSVAQAVIVVVVRDMTEGRRPSVSKGWAAAMARLPQLVGFAVVFAAERTATNMLRNTRGGKWAARALDYAWDFATYLAIPVIMFEPGVGAVSCVKRSAQLVRTRFGVTMVATGAIGLAVFVCAIPAFLVAFLVGSMVSSTTAVVFLIVVLLTEMVVASTLQGVCSAVMYRFVTTGVVTTTFSEVQLMRVFGSRPAVPAMAG